MPETLLLAAGLAFLMPLGYALIAAGGLAELRARHATLSILAALGLATVGYVAVGFALQFGGVGLVNNQPGYEGLVWEWSGLGATWGAGWGMAGLAGWGLIKAAATPAAYALALANLPWVVTAALIPMLSLRGRIAAWASGLLGLLVGAVIYPVAGNWLWGGGWLANLGANLGLGHGLVDPGGAGLVHLLGASVALAGILVLLQRRPRLSAAQAAQPVPLPPVHLPLLAVLGAGLLLVGNLAWTIANPLLDRTSINLAQLALNTFLAAAGGSLLPLLYTWFVAGTPDPLMAARGMAAGTIAVSAAAPFMAPPAALLLGAAVGVLIPLVVFVLDRIVRMDDPTAAVTVHGLGGALGLIAVGLLADGRTGVAWNGIGAGSYLGVARQGVTGLMAATGFQPDWPGQMQAQLIGFAALALFGFFVAWLVLAPPVTIVRVTQHLLAQRSALGGAATAAVPAIAQASPVPSEPAVSPAPEEPAAATEPIDPGPLAPAA